MISTLPVWNVFDVVPRRSCPTRTSPRSACRAGQVPLLLARPLRRDGEPVYILAPKELASWTHAPLPARRVPLQHDDARARDLPARHAPPRDGAR